MWKRVHFARLRAASVPLRHLTVSTVHVSKGKVSQDSESETVTPTQVLRAGVWKSLHLITSTLKQLGSRVPSRVGWTFSSKPRASLIPPASQWLPSNNRKVTLLAGLFGYGRQDVFEYQTRRVQQTHYNLTGQFYIPVRNYKIPDVLPSWVPEPDKAGLTYTVQFSPEDMTNVSDLALSELKAFLDRKKVKYDESQYQKTHTDQGLFNTRLEVLVDKDLKLNRISGTFKIPAVLQLLLRHIYEYGPNTRGIFSTPDNKTKCQVDEGFLPKASCRDPLIKDLQDNFYKDPTYKIGSGYNVHDVTAVLKHFLRELPVPLVTSHKFNSYPEMTSLSTYEKHLNGMTLFLMTMKQEYRDTLMMLLVVLHQIVINGFNTMIDTRFLSTLIAPCLFRFDNNKIYDVDYYNHLTRSMIHFNELLFIVPASLHSLLRAKVTPPKKKKFLEKLVPFMSKKEKEHDILVWAPDLEKTSDIIKIDSKMILSAFDVVGRYTNGLMDMQDYWQDTKNEFLDTQAGNFKPLYLFEIGGNIGERCLLPNTNMMQLNKINPEAEYVIKKSMGPV